MTLKQERAYKDAIYAAEEAVKEFDRRNDAGEFDDMEDDAWEELMDTTIHAVYLAEMAYSDAKVKVIRPNDWMKNFLKSFGREVKGRELSNKQADVFLSKAQEWYGKHSCDCYCFRYDGLFYMIYLPKYSRHYYLEIRPQFC